VLWQSFGSHAAFAAAAAVTLLAALLMLWLAVRAVPADG